MALRNALLAISLMALVGCSSSQQESDWVPSGTPVTSEFTFVPDEDPDRVKTLIFASVDPRYVAEHAGYFADIGVDGLMVCNVMSTWHGDIWNVHPRFAPNGEAGRIVGEGNPLFQMCREMNRRCSDVGIDQNSLLVAVSYPVPDWFDDEEWGALCERFRQCAIFARDAGFAGIAFDIEYVSAAYLLDYEPYLAPGYPRDRMRNQARQRGDELVSAMLGEFPDMIFWQLPEGSHYYGPLAVDFTVGMVGAMARANAPGGYHLNIEGTYTVTHSLAILDRMHDVDATMRENLATLAEPSALDYWERRGTISSGLWPLGYYRAIFDSVTGERLGFGGKYETYGDSVIGSYADKSANFSVEEFRRQYATARMASRAYTWIYCHGSVLWELSPVEQERYEGNWVDSLPLAENLDEYVAVLREKAVIDDALIARYTATVREGGAPPAFEGYAPTWWHIGPFPHRGGSFEISYPPEESIAGEGPDLGATFPAYPGYEPSADTLRWRAADVDTTGYVDLKALVSRQDSVLSYSVAWVEVPDSCRVQIRFGSNDDGAVWVDGQPIVTHTGPRGAMADNDVYTANLPAGRTPIMVKIGDLGGAGYGFYLRVTDDSGASVPGLRWVTP